MNIFYKLFVVKRTEDTCILLYGYGLPDTNEIRGWNSGLIDKKLNLYRLTCVMNEEKSLEFQDRLISQENIELTKGFTIKSGFIQRPETIMYPKEDFNNRSESLLKSLSRVKEYWNLNKMLLVQELQEVYESGVSRKQREKIHDVIIKISEEVSLNFLNEASDRLGNVEIYSPNEWDGKFKWEAKKIKGKTSRDISVKGIKINKKENIELDLLVNCVLSNSNRCVLNQIKEMNSNDDYIEFDSNEDISEVCVNIWSEESGELVYTSHANLSRQMIFSMNINNNTKYLLHDEWSDKLQKTFGGSKEKIKKLDKIRTVEHNSIPMVSKVGDFKNDPWNEAGELSRRLIKVYRKENPKGAFCKKIGEGECEIDSFCKIVDYLNQSRVNKVIIVDPYFSIKAMEKFLCRVKNSELRLEIITSLNDIDPDKYTNVAKNTNYLNEVREFLRKNNNIIHQYLRIINITQNKNTAIHDRYLLRLLDDGTIDGYLLSNSLNSAGQNYSFVIAPMDKEVTYNVLEYINEIKDEEIQKKKSKTERLQIETLWDTYDEKYIKKDNPIVPIKEWEKEMKFKYDNKESIKLEELFYNGWDLTEEKAKESILKISWYLYYTDDRKILDDLLTFINFEFDTEKFLLLCNKIAIELEKEQEIYEKNNFDYKYKEVISFRKALDKERQKEVKINFQYLMKNGFIHVFYKVNGYILSLYRIIYHINHEKLIDIMEKAHSPMAMKLLLEKMIFDCEIDFEVYNRLIISDIEGLKELAYYYFDTIIITKIKNGECLDYKVFANIPDDTAIYQYASCIETMSFEIERMKENSRSNIKHLAKLSQALKHFVEEEINLMNKKEFTFDENKVFKLLNGPNIKINCNNYILILEQLYNKECENIFLRRMIKSLQQKWETGKQFFDNDYDITYYTAYACLKYWNNDVETIFKELKINNKSLYIATESGKYDMNFDEWNKSVQKVLWQLLFLKNYKKLLEESGNNIDKNYNKILNKISELSVIKDETDKWYDCNGLVSKIFDN
ncbi:hypothetical protein U729_310 [Clostridium baratii str. Sullivan]|uniref:Uncharacterized protein n=1 Tax=Clostridium baratii str. Sullivan TaxID=1415775 RepID=A0A0A7FS34_9CLOT|nr:VPA1262 family protein [Clostridium baratii]AIY82454.1 hypothetical protein U729_310 [Clostridium baratii str. Sullivan]